MPARTQVLAPSAASGPDNPNRSTHDNNHPAALAGAPEAHHEFDEVHR